MNCNKNPNDRGGLTSMFRVILKYLQPENMAPGGFVQAGRGL